MFVDSAKQKRHTFVLIKYERSYFIFKYKKIFEIFMKIVSVLITTYDLQRVNNINVTTCCWIKTINKILLYWVNL